MAQNKESLLIIWQIPSKYIFLENIFSSIKYVRKLFYFFYFSVKNFVVTKNYILWTISSTKAPKMTFHFFIFSLRQIFTIFFGAQENMHTTRILILILLRVNLLSNFQVYKVTRKKLSEFLTKVSTFLFWTKYIVSNNCFFLSQKKPKRV